jgi:HTH-type transcriptional regulator, transcriptional repressor of NAD biosynthesis genes
VLFGECPDWIRATAQQRQYDLYLLLDVDVPWVDDQQRYLPHARREFFERCRKALESHCRPFVVIRGNWWERLEQACRHAQNLLY